MIGMRCLRALSLPHQVSTKHRTIETNETGGPEVFSECSDVMNDTKTMVVSDSE